MPNNTQVHYGTGKLAAVLSIRVETTPSEKSSHIILMVVHYFSSYMAFCDRALEESSDTLHWNTEKYKSSLVRLHEHSAGIYVPVIVINQALGL